MYVFEDVA